MSAALWHFFWTESDWTAAPAPTPAPAPTQDLGSGGGSKRRKKTPAYIRAPEDFWDARERFLQSLQPEILTEPAPSPIPPVPSPEAPRRSPTYNPLPRYLGERIQLISDIQSLTSDLTKLKAQGDRLIAINRAISIEKRYQAEQRTRRHLARSRKLATLLAVAQALLSLLHRL